MKFVPVFMGVGLLALLGLWVGRRFTEAAEVITGIRPGLLAHALIGFWLVPPVLLKLGSTGY